MKNFKVNGALGEFELNLPESLEEIPVDYFKECTDLIMLWLLLFIRIL